MINNENIYKTIIKYFQSDKIFNLTIKEKAALEMLQQKKMRKLLNNTKH